MKNVILLLSLFMLLLISFQVNADMGPKDHMEINVKYNNQSVNEPIFYSIVLDCSYPIRYEAIIKEIAREGEAENHFDMCMAKIAKYGLNETDCYSIQNLVEKEELDYGLKYRCEFENKEMCRILFPLKILDSEKECFWTYSVLAWGGECKDSKCSFSYMLPSDMKIAIYLPSQNKTFISNEIIRETSYYDANILPEGSIELKEGMISLLNNGVTFIGFFPSLIITIAIEIFIAFLYIILADKKKAEIYQKNQVRILFTIVIGNLISLPIVWFIFPLIEMNSLFILVLSEIFAIIFEGFFLNLLNKKIFPIKNALILSLIMNLASFFVGEFIYLLLTLV